MNEGARHERSGRDRVCARSLAAGHHAADVVLRGDLLGGHARAAPGRRRDPDGAARIERRVDGRAATAAPRVSDRLVRHQRRLHPLLPDAARLLRRLVHLRSGDQQGAHRRG
jgi:hypothetical protein